ATIALNVSGDQSRPEQLPERSERARRVEARAPREILRERSAAQLQVQQHVLHLGIQVRARRRRRAKPAGIVAQCEADATRPRAARLTRLEHGPHDLAGEAEAIE